MFRINLMFFGWCFLFLWHHPQETIAQIYSSSEALSLGGSARALPPSVGNLHNNPASLGADTSLAVLLGFRYMYHQPDVKAQVIMLQVPIPKGNIGIIAKRFGLDEVYKDITFELSYIRRFAPDFFLSLAGYYNQLYVPDYLKIRKYGIRMGSYFILSEQLTLAGTIQKGLDDTHIDVGIGACYKFSSQLLVVTDFDYNQLYGLGFKIGNAYQIMPAYLSIRGGLEIFKKLPYAGFGLSYNRMTLDFATSFHPYLGMSPQVDLKYLFR